MPLTENNLRELQNELLNQSPLFDVELSTFCNKSCYICPRENFVRKNKNMSPSVFAFLADWLPEECDVMFAGYGEPLLNPNVFDFISNLKSSTLKKICLSLYTNGKNLTKEVVARLFDSGLDLLQISILIKDEMNSLENFFDLFSKEYYSSKIRFNLMCSDSTEIDFSKIEGYKNSDFELCLKKIHNRGGELYPYNYDGKIKSCGTFFMDTFIDADGNIQICSNDINGKNCLGNIREISFDDLKKLKAKYFGNHKVADICSHCSDEYRVKHFEEVL